MSLVLLLIFVLVALPAGLLILIALQTSPLLGVGLVVSLYIVDTAFGGLPPVEFGLNVYAPDVVFSMLLIAGAMRFLKQRKISSSALPLFTWLLFGLAIAISLTVGLSRNGSQAVVGARQDFYFWSCVFYLMNFSFSLRDLERLFRGIVLSAGLLCLIVLFRWASDAIGIADYTIYGAGVAYRVAPAMAAYFIGIAALIAYVFRLGRPLLLIFLSVVVILQHRSVWLAIGTAFLILMFESAHGMKRNLFYFGVGIVVAGIAATVLSEFSGGASILESVANSFASGTDLSEGTTYGRIANWQVLLVHWWDAGFANWMLGIPYGDDFEVYVRVENEFILLGFSAHNFYVQTLYNLGLVGLAAWCTAYAIALRFMWRNRGNTASGRANTTLFVLLVAGLVFFVAYQANYLHGIAVGLAFGLMRNSVIAGRRQLVGDPKLPIAQQQV